MGLRHWLRRRPSDADLRDELEAHIAMRAEYDEADQTAARRRFGNELRVREDMRNVWRPDFWDSIAQDARFTWRTWRRYPAFSLAAVGALALGLGSATALFSVCDRILFRSLPYPDADRLVSVGLLAPLDANEFLLSGDYAQLWRDTPPPFKSTTTVNAGTSACDLTETHPERLTCAAVETNLLRVLELPVIAGRDFAVSDAKPGAPRVALITHGLWLRRFGGDPYAVGRMLSIDGQTVEIAGVLPRDFELPTLARADVLFPLQLSVTPGTPGGMQFLRGFARLKSGITPSEAHAALQPVFREMLKNVPSAYRAEVTLRVRSLRDRQLGDSRRAAWLLLGAAGALLLIACTNVANLLLARTAARQRELAVRAALGAGRARLARLALTESAILAAAGAVIGLTFASVLLRVFLTLAPRSIPKLDQASLDWRATLAAICLGVVATLLTGMWPAASTPRGDALQGSRSIVAVRPRTRFGFIVVQIGLTFALLGTSMLLLRSLWRLQSVALGFETERVLAVPVALNAAKYSTPERQIAVFEQLLERITATPGTIAAAVSDSIPPSGSMRATIFAGIEVAGRPLSKEGTGGMVGWRLVTPAYFDALRIPIVRGRSFAADDRRSPEPAMILSEALERKLFPNESGLGKRVRPGRGEQPWHVVVGIARDTRNGGLTVAPEPEYYVVRGTTARDATRRSYLLVRTQRTVPAAAAFLRDAVGAVDAELPVNIETMDQRVASLSARPRFTAFLLVSFGVLALLLACAGVAGVAGYLVAERTRDIGVRMALGATPAAVRREVLADAARWVAGGTVLGVLVATAGIRLVRTLLYGVTPQDGWAWAAALVLLIIAMLGAALRPAIRASRIDPMSALRAE